MNAAINILKEGFDCYQKRTLQHSNCANETILFVFFNHSETLIENVLGKYTPHSLRHSFATI